MSVCLMIIQQFGLAKFYKENERLSKENKIITSLIFLPVLTKIWTK